MTGSPDWSRTELIELHPYGQRLAVHVRSGTDDINIAKEVIFNLYYHVARAFLDEKSFVIDVGAHIGMFSLCATTQGARVLAIEPVPGNFQLLQRNIETNNLQSRIMARQVALWSVSGVRPLGLARDSTAGSGFWHLQSTQPLIDVACYSLDDLMQSEGIEFCDLLKLDCEGAEFEVLSTLPSSTWDRIGAVLLEYHLWAGYTVVQLMELLETRGFLVRAAPSYDLAYGYVHAVRLPERLPALKPLSVTELDSPLTGLPLFGRVWHALRRPLHRLVVFYINELVSRQNRQNEQFSVYFDAMSAQISRLRRSNALPGSILLPDPPSSPPRFERRLCKLCNIEDWQGADWLAVLDELGLGYQRIESARHRKAWEWAQGSFGLKRLGFLHDKTRALSVGAGTEPVLYYLANHIAQVVATDIYGEGDFNASTAPRDMLTCPEKYAPFAYRHDHLSVQHRDGRKLGYEADSFDVVFSFSSIEHFGGHAAATLAIREMARVLRPGGILVLATELILNGRPHAEYFLPQQIFSELVEPSGLRLIEDIDFSLSARSLQHCVDWQTEDILTKVPLIVCRYGDIVWTSLVIFLEKPAPLT